MIVGFRHGRGTDLPLARDQISKNVNFFKVIGYTWCKLEFTAGLGVKKRACNVCKPFQRFTDLSLNCHRTFKVGKESKIKMSGFFFLYQPQLKSGHLASELELSLLQLATPTIAKL